MKCDLGFCDECTKYIINNKELDNVPSDTLINFSLYNYQGICEKHGIITNVPNIVNLTWYIIQKC